MTSPVFARLPWSRQSVARWRVMIGRVSTGRVARMSIGAFMLLVLAGLAGPMQGVAMAQTGKLVLIVMENEPYASIVGNSQAPYVNQLMAKGELFTNYAALVNDSLPDYLAMTSGLTSALSPPSPNIFQAIDGTVGTLHWKEFMESMAGNCGANSGATVPGSSDVLYTTYHDPAFTYVPSDTCSTNDVSMTASTFSPANLPDFSFVVPNQCDDMHTLPTNGQACPAYFGANNGTSLINMGDHWLATVVPPLLAQPNVTVLITWDEGDLSTTPPEHVVMLEAGAGVTPGSTDGTAYTHYGLEAGLYRYFGLGPAPNNGATATPLPIPPPGPPPVPTISSFSPSSGPVGTSVTISGTGLSGATSVSFAGTPASAFTVSSDTRIIATVPSGATSGPIAVTTPGGTATSSSAFIVTPPSPVISSFSPTSGTVGTSVMVTGANFTGATAVTLNGAPTAFTVNSDTQLTFTVPSGATSGPIAVTTPNGTGSSGTSFIVAVPPTISSFSPASGTAGTSVTVTGTGFTGATGVTLKGTSVSFSVASDTQLSFTVPAGATTGPIAVTTPGGTATSQANFTVTDFAVSAAPSSQTISRGGTAAFTVTVTPISGFTGPVTLTASNLPGGAKASFSPNPLTVSTSAASSTLTISTKHSVNRGTYTVTISAAGGHVTHTTTVGLVIQ